MQSPRNALPPDRRSVARRVQHAGVLVPWANSVVEAELPEWAGRLVAWHYARLVPPSGGTALDEDFLAGLLMAVPAALKQLAALPLERVYLACTSAAFMLPSRAKTAAAGARAPVITAFDAIIAALRQQQAGRIVLLTPYPERVCEAETGMFRDHGITVTASATLNLADGYSAIEPGQIRDLARQVSMRAVEEAQVIVLSCTGWPTLGLEKALIAELGKGVLSSNLAIVTHALRAGGGTR
jgi:maleate cis-trans isomerase